MPARNAGIATPTCEAADSSSPEILRCHTAIIEPTGTAPDAFQAFIRDEVGKFGQLAKEAIERTVKELQELRRQAASSIVVPQGPLPPMGGPGGGGKIQMP